MKVEYNPTCDACGRNTPPVDEVLCAECKQRLRRSDAIAECERILRTCDETDRLARHTGVGSTGAERAVWYSERQHTLAVRLNAVVHLLCQGVQSP